MKVVEEAQPALHHGEAQRVRERHVHRPEAAHRAARDRPPGTCGDRPEHPINEFLDFHHVGLAVPRTEVPPVVQARRVLDHHDDHRRDHVVGDEPVEARLDAHFQKRFRVSVAAVQQVQDRVAPRRRPRRRPAGIRRTSPRRRARPSGSGPAPRGSRPRRCGRGSAPAAARASAAERRAGSRGPLPPARPRSGRGVRRGGAPPAALPTAMTATRPSRPRNIHRRPAPGLGGGTGPRPSAGERDRRLQPRGQGGNPGRRQEVAAPVSATAGPAPVAEAFEPQLGTGGALHARHPED